MADKKDPPHWLITIQQAWFRPFVEVQQLPLFPADKLDHWIASNPGTHYTNILLGRGPFDHEFAGPPKLFFDYNDKAYPTFDCPGITSAEVTLCQKLVPRRIEADKDNALFLIEVYCLYPTTSDLFEIWHKELSRAGKDGGPRGGPASDLINGGLLKAREVLHSIIGAYVLYQYPLVWERLAQIQSLAIVDTENHRINRNETESLDTSIPFKLRFKENITDGKISDPIIRNVPSIANAKLDIPFLFLQHALWEQERRIRFIYQFWIIEYFASTHKYKDPEIRKFAKDLEKLVTSKFPAHLAAHFRMKKGELLRKPLIDNIRACFNRLGMPYNEALLKKAKRLRDQLSHGQKIDHNDLEKIEQEVRSIVRLLIRKELEHRRVRLDTP